MTQVRDVLSGSCATPKSFIAICLLTLASLSYLIAQNSEFMYSGKPESYYISLLTNIPSEEYRTNWTILGTNRLTVLLKAVGEGSTAAIRTNAAKVLSVTAPREILIKFTTNNVDPQVRLLMIKRLVSDSELPVAVRIAFLRDKDPHIRFSAMVGIGKTDKLNVRNPEILSVVLECLQDPDLDVRAKAADILSEPSVTWPGQTQEQIRAAALAEIQRATNNPNPEISAAAAKALKEQPPAISAFANEMRLELER